MDRTFAIVSPLSAVATARSGRNFGRVWTAVACLVVAAWSSVAPAAAPQGFRRLAPNALTVIPADKSTDDALQRADIVEITKGLAGLAWTPEMAAANTTLVERGRGREYPRDIWCLEFAFKPPRMIDVDVPAADARMQRKRIWYLIYRVKNVGGRRLLMAEDEAGQRDPAKRRTEPFEAPVRFLPHFVLESLEPVESGEGLTSYRGYLDRILPSAMEPIRLREDPKQKFLDSAEMSATDIAPGEERWGVATWEDIDPRIDFFSIYVRGLTNAVRWRQRPGSVIKPNDPPGSDIEETLESLRLDFWRPGDERAGGDREMSVGFAGMFERMSLGGRLLSAVGWPQHAAARPDVGLEALGLSWSDLLEPDAGGGAASLLPLETVLRRAAAVVPPADPIVALRALFGDLGVASIDELAAAAAGPVDAEQDQLRRAALQKLGLTPDAVAKEPLAALATIMRSLEEKPDIDARRAAATGIFGPKSRRIEWLADAVAKARCLATLRVIEADRSAFREADALAAFDAFRPAFDGLDEADKQRLLEGIAPSDPRRQRIDGLDDAARGPAVLRLVLQGVFGPGGPDLYAAAVAVNEGIDHAWVFRYETDVEGLQK
jgi:hypothetical protein